MCHLNTYNDLPEYIKEATRLFADDLKAIVNANYPGKTDSMLRDLESWEETWLLKFNPSKCKVMHLDFNNNPRQQYTFNNVTLDSINIEKDLGVLTTDKLSWQQQIVRSVMHRTCSLSANHQ